MLYSAFTDVLRAPALATAVSERFFFWFMVISGVVMFIGVAVEVYIYWRRDRILARQKESETPPGPYNPAAADESRLGKAR